MESKWEMKTKRSDKGGITIDHHTKKKSYGANGGVFCVGVWDRDQRAILLGAGRNQSGSVFFVLHNIHTLSQSKHGQSCFENGGKREEGETERVQTAWWIGGWQLGCMPTLKDTDGNTRQSLFLSLSLTLSLQLPPFLSSPLWWVSDLDDGLSTEKQERKKESNTRTLKP